MAQTTQAFTVPGQFSRRGVFLPGVINQDTLHKVEMGDVPDFKLLVASFPRSGSMRISEMVWLLLHNYDFTMASKIEVYKRLVGLEWSDIDFTDFKEASPPLIAKTHLPLPFLVNTLTKVKPKVIVGLRNPKDTLVSHYHLYRSYKFYGNYTGSWDEFFEMYCNNQVCFGDMFEHMLGWWKKRHEDNVFVVKYDDFNGDGCADTIRKTGDFLGVKVSDDHIKAIAEWITFDKMKENPMTNCRTGLLASIINATISPYMRKGTTGDWRNYFSPEQSAVINKLYQEKCVPEGLTFTF